MKHIREHVAQIKVEWATTIKFAESLYGDVINAGDKLQNLGLYGAQGL
jgi:hypothetical protein